MKKKTFRDTIVDIAHPLFLDHLSDETYLKLKFRMSMGRSLDLQNPKTYCEKLQWLKLHDRKPEYTQMVDKFEMKEYVAGIIGDGHTIPTIGVYNTFDDINFNALPNQFVIKCTHDSGKLVICTEKSKFNMHDARKLITKSLHTDFYTVGREWPYKNVKPRIIIEEYMEDREIGELRDYKFFMFHGVPKVFYITSGRKSGDCRTDFFDMNLKHLDIQDDDRNADVVPDFPKHLDEMIMMAKQLSKGVPHLRVDFYEVNGRVYVGELTFYYLGGFVPFKPEKWDEIFGSWLDITHI